jgi:methylated-DNA-[protein]-cysteine S-methyltransferase
MLETPMKDKIATEAYWSATLASTPVGPVSILVSSIGLAVVEFAPADEFTHMLVVQLENTKTAPDLLAKSIKQLDDYFKGKLKEFSLTLDLRGLSQFSQEILVTASKIPYGRARTYGSLAAAAGHPGAARAVGGVMSRNPIPVVIPCHRVVASDGALHGYSAPGGLKTKSWLLEFEGHTTKNLKLMGKSWKN